MEEHKGNNSWRSAYALGLLSVAVGCLWLGGDSVSFALSSSLLSRWRFL